MYDIGEKPGIGRYRCWNNCGWEVYLNNSDDRLPPCAKCPAGATVKYNRV